MCGDSRGLRGNVVYLDRLVEAELLLLRDGWTRQERVVSERFVGHGRWDQGSRTRFPPYIITSWFIAVRMLRLGRLRRHGARNRERRDWAWRGRAVSGFEARARTGSWSGRLVAKTHMGKTRAREQKGGAWGQGMGTGRSEGQFERRATQLKS